MSTFTLVKSVKYFDIKSIYTLSCTHNQLYGDLGRIFVLITVLKIPTTGRASVNRTLVTVTQAIDVDVVKLYLATSLTEVCLYWSIGRTRKPK